MLIYALHPYKFSIKNALKGTGVILFTFYVVTYYLRCNFLKSFITQNFVYDKNQVVYKNFVEIFEIVVENI